MDQFSGFEFPVNNPSNLSLHPPIQQQAFDGFQDASQPFSNAAPNPLTPPSLPCSLLKNECESEDGVGWNGTVIHMPSNFEDSEGEWEEMDDTDEGSLGIDADDDLEDIEGIELLEALRRQWEIEKDLRDLT
ncbi:hypothetical protein BDQ17DRAFT_1419700 [Cyathus striatus]|nr:hypothetical protein BDQ17DRAFT_1419700 [Cyathus striatus]